MIKENVLYKWKEIVRVILGSMIMGISIDLFVRANVGLDPLSLFQAGLGNVLHISLGNASILIMVSVIVILLFLDRRRVGIGSVLNSVLVGTFINLFSPYICSGTAGVVDQCISVALGLLLMGAGIGIYISAGIGEAGMDALMVYFSEKTGKNVRFIRILIDILLSVIGFILGGTLGVATIISMLVNGPIIQFTLKIINRVTGGKNGTVKISDTCQ